MIKRIAALALGLCLLLAAAGGLAEADTLRVTASFYPLYIAAINVTRDVPGVTVRSLAPPSAGCLHDYQMTTDDRRTIEASDVLILNGAGLEAFLDKLIDSVAATVIDASEGIALLGEEHDHGAHDAHRHGEENAHMWVSVPGMMAQVQNIAEGLAAADPAHAALYRQNAQDYVQRLDALYAQMHEQLDPLAGAPIVTFHEAFDYFARDFDLRVVATVSGDHGSAPSARQLADLSDTVRQEGVRALFAEPQYEDASVDILARETGLPVYFLDPATSGELDPTDWDAYIRIMQQNADTLVEALS